MKKLTKNFLIKEYSDNRKSMKYIANEIERSEIIIKFNILIRTISEAHKGKKRKPFSKEWKQKLSEALKGENNPGFKGKIKNDKGYILIYSPNHLYKTKQNYVFEQRLVVEKELGRYLGPFWVIHHINEIRDDNRPEI